MTNFKLTKDNFNGNWRLIPRNRGTQTQLILSKNMINKLGKYVFVCYNFNYDIKNHVIGQPRSLMNELLGLDENEFYKCIIGNESLTFIIMTDNEINEYNQKNNNQENNNKSISLNSISCNIEP